MTLQRQEHRYRVWKHLNQLRKFRNGPVLEAAKDWLDKEIADLEEMLYGKEQTA